MRLEHHLVGGYVRYISPYIIIIIITCDIAVGGREAKTFAGGRGFESRLSRLWSFSQTLSESTEYAVL